MSIVANSFRNLLTERSNLAEKFEKIGTTPLITELWLVLVLKKMKKSMPKNYIA